MTLTVNLRKMLHRKSAEYCAPLPAGNTAAGAFIIADKTSAMPGNDGIVYFGGASAVWQYNADEDAWLQAPNSGIAGTFGAGACGALHAVFAPGGADRSTATAGTTTTITTSLTLARDLGGYPVRVISGTGVGYQGMIVRNTLGANGVLTLSPASAVAFDNTTVFQMLTGSVWVFNPGAGAVGFSCYDRATNAWTARSVTGLPTTFGTDGKLVATGGATSGPGWQGFVNSTATAGAATTLTDTAKVWPVNGWANSQVRIISGTGAGQIRSIASNTANVLTVSAAWTVNPDATSVYRIEGNGNYIYLMGNNAVTLYRYDRSANTWSTLTPGTARGGAAAAGFSANWIDGIEDEDWTDETYGTHYGTMIRQAGRYIYSLRGGGTSTLDVYDLAANTWINDLPYAMKQETFITGSSAVDLGGFIYIHKDATGRIYRFDVAKNVLKPFVQNPVPNGSPVVGDKIFMTTYVEGTTRVNYLYALGSTRSELTRWLVI